MSTLMHGSCVCLGARGVLILGAPGAGKSGLALELVSVHRAVLVADDQVAITVEDNRLFAGPAPGLAGLIEIRGTGIVKMAYRRRCQVCLVASLGPHAGFDRMPPADSLFVDIGGIRLARIFVDASQPFAAARVLAGISAQRRQ